MLYYKFKNYEEFKQTFGLNYHSNGNKSRNNKILLAFIKDRNLLHDAVRTGNYELLHISSMQDLKRTTMRKIRLSGKKSNKLTKLLWLNGAIYFSAKFSTDEYNGICADMDLITGRGIEGFAVPCMWPIAPFDYPFSTGIDEFITCYKKSAKELGASRMKDIMIKHDEDYLNVRLFF